MAGLTNEQRAVKYVQAFEDAGKFVRRVVIEGARVEIDLSEDEPSDFELVNMKRIK